MSSRTCALYLLPTTCRPPAATRGHTPPPSPPGRRPRCSIPALLPDAHPLRCAGQPCPALPHHKRLPLSLHLSTHVSDSCSSLTATPPFLLPLIPLSHPCPLLSLSLLIQPDLPASCRASRRYPTGVGRLLTQRSSSPPCLAAPSVSLPITRRPYRGRAADIDQVEAPMPVSL